MASVRETMPTLCYNVDLLEASLSVVEYGAGTGSVMCEYLHHPWELQLPCGVLGAEPGNDDGVWATSTAGVSSSSSSSFPCMDDSTDQLSYGAMAPRAASNLFGFEGGIGTDATSTATNKRPRARAASQHGAQEEEEATTETNNKRCAKKRASTASTPPKEPQMSAAKNRRERVNERLKVLQELVPNGRKVDTVTMLDNAITYVKFMQLQLKVLETDAFWPTQEGKAPEMSQVKEALDAILRASSSSSQRGHQLF